MNQINTIAILITCYNRKEKTLHCLQSLYEVNLPDTFSMDVFLVDDGSTDGTSKAVLKNFPKVNIIEGDGNLFWNQGMRLAWDSAVNSKEFDFYLLLNDDTIMYKFSFDELLSCYNESLKIDEKSAIIVGACESSKGSGEFTYGGWMESGPVVPNGTLQSCELINGNVTIIPKAIYKQLGNFSSEYTHGIGDSDYGLRAINAGFNNYTTKIFIACCKEHEVLAAWCNPNKSLVERWKSLHSPKGLNIKEYNAFRRKFWGWKWIIFSIKVYFKVLSPNIYSKISNNLR